MKDDVLSMQIEQARNGDEQAIAGLIARQMPQILQPCAKAVRPGLDFDDAVQEGIIGLFSALETFDAQKGAGFCHLCQCVRAERHCFGGARGGTQQACAA